MNYVCGGKGCSIQILSKRATVHIFSNSASVNLYMFGLAKIRSKKIRAYPNRLVALLSYQLFFG